MTLLLDLGNTALKWAQAEGERLGSAKVQLHRGRAAGLEQRLGHATSHLSMLRGYALGWPSQRAIFAPLGDCLQGDHGVSRSEGRRSSHRGIDRAATPTVSLGNASRDATILQTKSTFFRALLAGIRFA